MNRPQHNIAISTLWWSVNEALHDAAEYARLKEIEGATEKTEEALQELKLLKDRDKK